MTCLANAYLSIPITLVGLVPLLNQSLYTRIQLLMRTSTHDARPAALTNARPHVIIIAPDELDNELLDRFVQPRPLSVMGLNAK